MKDFGIQPRGIRMLGGGAKNPLLCQIKADLLGIPTQTMAFPEAALMGNVILALVGIGHYKSVVQATARMARVDGTYDPDPANRQCYEHGYKRYKDLTHRIYPQPGKLEQ
jgi:xylulokinase